MVYHPEFLQFDPRLEFEGRDNRRNVCVVWRMVGGKTATAAKRPTWYDSRQAGRAGTNALGEGQRL